MHSRRGNYFGGRRLVFASGSAPRFLSTDSVLIAFSVIYDDDITDEFIHTLAQILDPADYNVQRNKEIYIALEKRYVFTLSELDTSAPCYEYFLRTIEPLRVRNGWKMETISIDFPQYFEYGRVRDLVLLKLYL